jgi:hypothetical protein
MTGRLALLTGEKRAFPSGHAFSFTPLGKAGNFVFFP